MHTQATNKTEFNYYAHYTQGKSIGVLNVFYTPQHLSHIHNGIISGSLLFFVEIAKKQAREDQARWFQQQASMPAQGEYLL